MVKVVSPPSLSALISPPWASTISLAMGKTQAGATRRLPTSRIASVEAVEYMLEVLGGYLLALIAHGQDDGVAILSVFALPVW